MIDWKNLRKSSTLSDLDSSCPGSLLKTTPPPPGYPWVSGGRYVTPEPKFMCLVLDHQGLQELELKKHLKLYFWSNLALFDRFFGSDSFKRFWLSSKPLNAESVTKDLPRASRLQAILKFCPPSSLDYKARHGPQLYKLFFSLYCWWSMWW